MREIELKLLLDECQERLLRSGAAVERAAIAPAATRSLLSTYYDTPDRALQRAGIALRLRSDGERWVQTAKKAPGAIAQGLSTPIEDECTLSEPRLDLSRIADPGLREDIRHLSAVGLSPVAETAFSRTARLLNGPGGAEVELAVDTGELRAGGAAAPIREAEFELKRGPAEDVFALARTMLTRGPVRFSNRTKAERAAALATGGRAFDPPAPVPPAPPRLPENATVEDAAVAQLGEVQHRISANIVALVDAGAGEAARQVGRALDDLRAAATALAPALGPAWLDLLERHATAIHDMLRGAGHEDEGLRSALTGPETTAFALDLAGFVALRGWRAGGADPAMLAAPARTLPGIGSTG